MIKPPKKYNKKIKKQLKAVKQLIVFISIAGIQIFSLMLSYVVLCFQQLNQVTFAQLKL